MISHRVRTYCIVLKNCIAPQDIILHKKNELWTQRIVRMNRHAIKQVARMRLAQQNRKRPKSHQPPQGDMANALLNATSDHALLMRADGTVLTANSSMARIFKLSPEQLTGERIYDFLPCSAAEKLAEAVRSCLASHRPIHFEDALSTGQELEVRMHPVPMEAGAEDRVAVFCRDISEQKAAERERTRLASALEQAADAVILFDEQMRIEYLNQSFEAMTGYTLRELRGRAVAVLYSGPEQESRLDEVSRALTRGDTWNGKACNTCKDGRVICCHKTVAPIRGKGGCILGYVSVWRDVTAVETLERQLRQAQKMEAIGTLASGIAHDFNNILSPIVLLADIGLRQLAEGDPLRSSFESILKASLRARDLVRQILGLGRRLESDQPQPLRVAAILQECLALVRPGLPSSIGIGLKVHTERDVIMADPVQMHQLVMNLCTNAAWAMRGTGGTLEFGIAEQEIGPRGDPEFPAAEPGSYVLLRVRDSGQGILPEHLERIFDPFFSTKTDGSGTGLGLAVVQNIVSQLRGAIRVFSEPGRGASFEILLPRSEALPHAAHSQAPLYPLEGAGCVLVVDDEQDILDACSLGLSSFGYEVTCCRSGEDALALFSQNPKRFDAVLSDTTMPGLAGPDLVRELLKIEPHLPVILTTGHSARVSRERAWRLGVLEYLVKPFRMDVLAAALNRLLKGRREPGAAEGDQ